MRKSIRLSPIAFLLLAACATKTQTGAVVGAAGGAVAGGVIGKVAGSTAKGAILTYGNLWSSAIASALHLGHHAADPGAP